MTPSPLSDPARSDMLGTAFWISRPTSPDHRIVRSLDSDHVAWAEKGEVLGQRFTSPGEIMAVSVDLTCALGVAVVARLELVDGDGVVVADRRVRGGIFPWDRFAHYVEVPSAPAPAGVYELRVIAEEGRVGWRTATGPQPAGEDDGFSPLRVDGAATRGGIIEPGVRTIGVETVPAPNPVFRRTFAVDDEVVSASLVGVGLGYGEFTLNGTPVGEGILDPAPTQYDRTVLFRRHDVTGLLTAGENELRVDVGRGFFATRGASTWAWNLAPWHREPMAIAHLEWTDRAGRVHVIDTNNTWQSADGAARTDVLYTGIVHDAAATQDTVWSPAVIVDGPGGVLRPAELPEIVRLPELPTVHRTDRTDAEAVYDFGSIMAGRLAITLTARSGAEIVVRYGEYLDADGSVSCDNILAAGETQTDRYLADGSENQTRWEPAFTYKGFRFASVTVIGDAEVHDVVAVPLRTDLREVGDFDSDEPTLTWIEQATTRTFLNNIHGIPTDTPVYEKNGWTADAHLATEAVLHRLDLRSTFVKWLDDHVDAQAPDGSIPQIIPTPGWGAAIDPTWSSSLVLIAWNLYWEYGDRAILERFAEPMRAYTDLALRIIDDAGGIWPHHSWGDWLAPGHQFAPEGPAPTTTMMVLHLAQRMALISRELERPEDAERYEAAAERIADAYHATFFDADRGAYWHPTVGYRQVMNILPLAFGAAPAEEESRVLASLVDDIENRTGGHLDCGSVGTKYLLPALTAAGRGELAVTVATQQTRPGWGVWRAAGSETLWESWDLDARSHEHYFLGSAAGWVQQSVGGLRATSPGWRSFEVAPLEDARITRASIQHETPLGIVRADWTRSDSQWVFGMTVPPGSEATVIVPGGTPIQVGPGEHRITLARREEAVA